MKTPLGWSPQRWLPGARLAGSGVGGSVVRHRTWTQGTQCVVAIILTTGMELTFEDKIIILKTLFLIGPSWGRHTVP